MREYTKRIKRLIREYAARAYEAELGQALGELEQQFSRLAQRPDQCIRAERPHPCLSPGSGPRALEPLQRPHR